MSRPRPEKWSIAGPADIGMHYLDRVETDWAFPRAIAKGIKRAVSLYRKR